MTSCGGTGDRLAVLCASTLNLSNRKPSVANPAVRGVGASPSDPVALAAQPASQHLPRTNPLMPG